jgi:hypothetical protein
VGQLEPAARHVRHGRVSQPQVGGGRDQFSSLEDGTVTGQELAGENQRAGAFARGGQPLLDGEEIGADFSVLAVVFGRAHPVAGLGHRRFLGDQPGNVDRAVANRIALRRIRAAVGSTRTTAMGM